ncbi:chemotaxis protein CheW [Halodesulfurarchaeum sp. HSR-GB]|uniref:chemotaxis protein CheW n=1 Tax=Halodesulfurarchaeum sp. HSR-GB TaxID=3074077 RepID=UPI00285BA878|nr:chemotaxis protein CheW [Halodesulfurarchaeum sp. HSR-GB]MDR5656859.1 chemotaxis protein CheW [Halodesulfurarchaeum sp. HSR-GB]
MTATDSDTAMAPEKREETAAEPATEVVEFTLGAERCAIDIDAVDSIVEPKQITRVPRAPEAVEGVMDLRGETTAVVDPTLFLAIEDDGTAENILVLDRDGDKQKIGIRVGSVEEVTGYPPAQIDRNGDLAGIQTSAIEADLVQGVLRKHLGEVDEDGVPEDISLVLWLDIARLIDAISTDGPGA